VSTTPFLHPPDGLVDSPLTTTRGEFAAHSVPASGQAHLGSVVLVPGLTGSKEDFIAVLGPIAAAGYNAWAFDQRGQFETPGPVPATWALDDFAADLLAVVAAIDDGPVHIVGHSFGGLVARAAVLAEPARFASLVLLDSGPSAVPEPQAGTLKHLAGVLDAYGLAPVWDARVAADQAAGVEFPADPAIREFLRRRFFANDPGSLGVIAGILATAPDRTDELARAGIPVLVAFGANDADAWPPEIQREVASRLGVQCVSFPEAAHSPAAESPADTAQALVSFWSGVDSAGQPPQAEEGL
jgi:pimeloyl-ACP methyl ester carboxylesterase